MARNIHKQPRVVEITLTIVVTPGTLLMWLALTAVIASVVLVVKAVVM